MVRSLRFIISSCLFCLAAVTFSAERAGDFKDSQGAVHHWNINFSRTLIWDNQPYIPVGVWLKITDPIDEAKYDLIQQSGITDVILETPLAPGIMPSSFWQNAIDLCEKKNLHYLFALGSPPPQVSGYQISPQSFRVPNLEGVGTETVRVPGADKAFFALVDKSDSSVFQTGHVNSEDGAFKISLRPKSTGDFVLLLYPHFEKSPALDYWEGYDAYRDILFASMKEIHWGKMFRGCIDPFGKNVRWMDEDQEVVPDSRLFQSEFEKMLRRTYQNIDKINISWSLSEEDITSYEQASRLVPLYAKGRGIGSLWDPSTDKILKINTGISTYWRDFHNVIKEASVRRAKNLAIALKKVAADIPIVYTWNGWSPIVEPQDAASDGIGMSGQGKSYEVVENRAAYSLASIFDWSPAGWLLGTEVSADGMGKTEYSNENALQAVLEWFKSLGAKGFFARVNINKDTLSWIGNYAKTIAADKTLSTYAPTAVFFPEQARSPAETTRLSPFVWWLPTNAPGGRFDWGSQYDGYYITRPNGTFVYVWSHGEPQQVTFHLIDPKSVKVTSFTGEVVETKVKKDTVTFTVGNTPVLLSGAGDAPVPQEAIDETFTEFAKIVLLATKRKIDITDLKSLMDSNKNLTNRSPGAGYDRMRRALELASERLAPYLWIEAENSTDNLFGDTPFLPGSSNGKVIRLSTTIEPASGSYYARYEITLGNDGDYNLWAAGTPPGENNASPLEWLIDTTPINVSASAASVAKYAGKLSWFSLGSGSIKAGKHTLTIKVRANSSGIYEALLDVLLLTPKPFKPDGIRKPPVD